MHPKIKHKSQGTYSGIPEVPSEHLATVTLEHDRLCTLVPSSDIGSCASQPCEPHRLTLVVLMEIII